MAKTNKFNVPNGLMNQGKVADIPEFLYFYPSSKFNKIIYLYYQEKGVFL